MRDADGLSTRLEQDVRFRLDDRGFLTGLEFRAHRIVLRPGDPNPFVKDTKSIATGNDEPDLPAPLAVEAMNRAFFALALMNCRNVTLRERGSRNGAGSAPSGDAFHEVVIDGNVRGSGAAVGEAGDGSGRRHLARGHFKTFTEDAPLLGKHVGTYWWGWQVRGQEGSGIIEKTYTLKPSRR